MDEIATPRYGLLHLNLLPGGSSMKRFDVGCTAVAAEEQVSCDLAGEAVILQIQDGVHYELEPK